MKLFKSRRRTVSAIVLAVATIVPVGVASAATTTSENASAQGRVLGSRSATCTIDGNGRDHDQRGRAWIKVTRYSDGRRWVQVDWTLARNYSLTIYDGRDDPVLRRKSSPHYVKADNRVDFSNVWKNNHRGYWVRGSQSHSVYATWRIDDTDWGGDMYWYGHCQTKAFVY